MVDFRQIVFVVCLLYDNCPKIRFEISKYIALRTVSQHIEPFYIANMSYRDTCHIVNMSYRDTCHIVIRVIS